MPLLRDLLSDKDQCRQQAANVLASTFGVAPAAEVVSIYVPGRVEFLGKHTDYAGGRTVVLAVDRGFRLVAAARKDKQVRIADAAGTDVRQFEYGQTPAHAPGDWVNYCATVARRLSMNFGGVTDLKGVDMAFVSDLPPAAGMSSSSALIVTTFLGIVAVNRLDQAPLYRAHIHDKLELAAYAACNENGQTYGQLTGEKGVGTFGGSEDHTAMLCCKEGMLSQFSYAPSVFERDLPWPAGYELVIGCSGVEAVKTGSAMAQYNRASIRARKAADAFNRATGSSFRLLRQIALHVGKSGLGEAKAGIAQGVLPEDKGEDLPGRFEQFFLEDQEIIPALGDDLLAGRLDRLDALVDRSHKLADMGLQNQVPQTNFLQQQARKLGALASSYFGAGFGGSVWAMVEKGKTSPFIEAWKQAYTRQFPRQAGRCEFFTTRPGRPASW